MKRNHRFIIKFLIRFSFSFGRNLVARGIRLVRVANRLDKLDNVPDWLDGIPLSKLNGAAQFNKLKFWFMHAAAPRWKK